MIFDEALPKPKATQPTAKRRRRWLFVAAGFAAYLLVGRAIVEFRFRGSGNLAIRSGTATVLGMHVVSDGEQKGIAVVVYGQTDPIEIVDAIAARPIAHGMSFMDLQYVHVVGVWPFTYSASTGYLFEKGANGEWHHADKDELAHRMSSKTD